MKNFILLLCILSFAFSTNAQHNYCNTDALIEELKINDPQQYLLLQKSEQDWLQYQENNKLNQSQKMTASGNVDTLINIPIVFHVLWNTVAENISDARILDQVKKLNEDYNRLNADTVNTRTVFKGIAKGARFNFYLVNRDPNGMPTNGINRVNTYKTGFSGSGFTMKTSASGGADPWPNDRYCNIWVCDFIDGGLLGFATLPTGGAIGSTDGIVLETATVGGTTVASTGGFIGRTLTHEMGHWLGLFHVWGNSETGAGDGTGGFCNDDDNIDDTPVQDCNYWGCPTGLLNTCTPDLLLDKPDNYENYMDYVDDVCMNMFSAGQAKKMYYTFFERRFQLSNTSAWLQFYVDNQSCEAFTTDDQLNYNWVRSNQDGKKKWEVDTVIGALVYDNFTNTDKSSDNVFSPGYYNIGLSSITLNFDYSYAMKTGAPTDTLLIWYSVEMGIWKLLDTKFGATLSTSPATSTAHIPSASTWTSASYTVPSPNNSTISNKTQIRFENRSAKGNRLYIDNVCATPNLSNGIIENDFQLSIYPNPATDLLNISYPSKSNETFTALVFDAVGKVVINAPILDNSIAISTLSKGVYSLKVMDKNGNKATVKFVKL
jgi:hypothetical protein